MGSSHLSFTTNFMIFVVLRLSLHCCYALNYIVFLQIDNVESNLVEVNFLAEEYGQQHNEGSQGQSNEFLDRQVLLFYFSAGCLLLYFKCNKSVRHEVLID